jgi:hypothetical protein
MQLILVAAILVLSGLGLMGDIKKSYLCTIMNFIILGIIFLVAVIGIIAVVYITKQSSIPDCSQKDGTADGVSQYKLNDDKSDCVIDTCASGYALSTDQSTCVSTDCSKQDGTAENVKSYKFDSSLVGCVIDTCVDNSTLSNGVCSSPGPPPPPPSSITTSGSDVVVPETLTSSDGQWFLRINNPIGAYMEIYHNEPGGGKRRWNSDGYVGGTPVKGILQACGGLYIATKEWGGLIEQIAPNDDNCSAKYQLIIQPGNGALQINKYDNSGNFMGTHWHN